jgi:hypothetical protein
MATEIRSIDAKGRLSLPKSFANSTVLVEQISDTEILVRKAKVVPHDNVEFSEERPIVLSDRDRDAFLAALAKPPKANAALKKAVAKYRKRHG